MRQVNERVRACNGFLNDSPVVYAGHEVDQYQERCSEIQSNR